MSVQVSTSAELVAASFDALAHVRVRGRAVQAWAPWSGFFAARDGWVRLHGNYPHHAAVIASVLRVRSREDLVRVAARLPAEEIETAVTDAGGIATVVRAEEAWSAHPHQCSSGGQPWYETAPGAPRPRLGLGGGAPLAGVRVLDLTRVIAGPTCSQLLACLGADVLRVDPPSRPELLGQHLSNGMGKRSVEVDLAVGADRIRDLVLPQADVVLLGYRPGALARYGLDAETLTGTHPSLVVGSLSAWGERGPWRHRRGFDSIVQAATGIAELYRSETGPGALPVQALDHATGHVLAAGVLRLLAGARGGLVRANLLGAARELLTRPRSAGADTPLQVPTIEIDSPYGRVRTVPPAVLIDGRPLHAPLTGYGAARLGWA